MSKNDEIRKLTRTKIGDIRAGDKGYFCGKRASEKMKKEWEERQTDAIIFDGIIEHDESEQCDIMFLLKEATRNGYKDNKDNEKETRIRYKADWFPTTRGEFEDKGVDFWDFIKMTNDTIRDSSLRIQRIWPDLCCWTKLYRGEDDSFKNVKGYYKSNYGEINYSVLKGTAIVNLKKTVGASTSSDTHLNKVAQECGELIRIETGIIKPKLILCCGTYEQAKIIFGVNNKIEPISLDCGSEYFIYRMENAESIIVVKLCHPAARVGEEVLFAYVKEVHRELTISLRQKGIVLD